MRNYEKCPFCGVDINPKNRGKSGKTSNLSMLNSIGILKIKQYAEILTAIPAYSCQKVTARITECGIIRK